MSRATWYRLGKPETKPKKRTLKEQLPVLKAAGLVKSVRSYKRMMRALQSPLAPYVASGEMSASQADKILAEGGGMIDRPHAAMAA